MASIRQIFNPQSPYPEDNEKFFKFMERFAKPFFSHVGDTRFDVQYLLVKSVINSGRRNFKGAKHRRTWIVLSMVMKVVQTNSNHHDYHKAMINKMIIEESGGSYEKLMNLIQKYLDDIFREGFQFNVVKYVYQEQKLKHGRLLK